MILRCSDLSIGYGAEAIQTSLSLQAEEGELICMLGKNGCGKSTLLRTLAGLQPMLKGTIEIQGRSLSDLTQHQQARLLSLVLTERLSIEQTHVNDVVAMGRYPYSSFLGGLTTDDQREIGTALQQVGLADKRNRYFNCLSDGEKQRVLIAKALAQQTPLILLDEPTAHLDLPNRIKTLLLLKQLAHTAHKCVIISTHELDLALQLADTLWLMSQTGITIGTPQALIQTGAFQSAFADDSFSFENRNGQLSITIRESNNSGKQP